MFALLAPPPHVQSKFAGRRTYVLGSLILNYLKRAGPLPGFDFPFPPPFNFGFGWDPPHPHPPHVLLPFKICRFSRWSGSVSLYGNAPFFQVSWSCVLRQRLITPRKVEVFSLFSPGSSPLPRHSQCFFSLRETAVSVIEKWGPTRSLSSLFP